MSKYVTIHSGMCFNVVETKDTPKTSRKHLFRLSKKCIKKAVSRNAIKRYLRHNVSLKPGKNLVFIAKKSCLKHPIKDLKKQLQQISHVISQI